LHNFHTIVFTIIPSTITHVHEFHEFHQQKINFEPNDQNMSNENIITKWKVYKTPHNPILLLSHNGQGFMFNDKENDHTILYLYYF